jgi:hypothetical protein
MSTHNYAQSSAAPISSCVVLGACRPDRIRSGARSLHAPSPSPAAASRAQGRADDADFASYHHKRSDDDHHADQNHADHHHRDDHDHDDHDHDDNHPSNDHHRAPGLCRPTPGCGRGREPDHLLDRLLGCR